MPSLEEAQQDRSSSLGLSPTAKTGRSIRTTLYSCGDEWQSSIATSAASRLVTQPPTTDFEAFKCGTLAAFSPVALNRSKDVLYISNLIYEQMAILQGTVNNLSQIR